MINVSQSSPKVLVTGHTGFIGRHVCCELSKRGFVVSGASRSMGVDLENPDALTDMEVPKVIVHLAGKAGVQESWEDPAGSMRGNLLPALSVFEQARIWSVPVILVSSYMYGIPRTNPVDESHPVMCKNPYAHAKRLVETMAAAYHQNFGVAVSVLRPFNLYGPGQDKNSLPGLVLDQVRNAKAIEVNDLAPRRDYLHIADFASAIAEIALRPGLTWDIFNIGSGNSHSVAEFIDLAQRAAGTAKPVIEKGSPRVNEIPECFANTQRFCEAYDWTPRYTLASGLAETLQADTT